MQRIYRSRSRGGGTGAVRCGHHNFIWIRALVVWPHASPRNAAVVAAAVVASACRPAARLSARFRPRALAAWTVFVYSSKSISRHSPHSDCYVCDCRLRVLWIKIARSIPALIRIMAMFMHEHGPCARNGNRGTSLSLFDFFYHNIHSRSHARSHRQHLQLFSALCAPVGRAAARFIEYQSRDLIQ